jgi:hypothetical protein
MKDTIAYQSHTVNGVQSQLFRRTGPVKKKIKSNKNVINEILFNPYLCYYFTNKQLEVCSSELMNSINNALLVSFLTVFISFIIELLTKLYNGIEYCISYIDIINPYLQEINNNFELNKDYIYKQSVTKRKINQIKNKIEEIDDKLAIKFDKDKVHSNKFNWKQFGLSDIEVSIPLLNNINIDCNNIKSKEIKINITPFAINIIILDKLYLK